MNAVYLADDFELTIAKVNNHVIVEDVKKDFWKRPPLDDGINSRYLIWGVAFSLFFQDSIYSISHLYRRSFENVCTEGPNSTLMSWGSPHDAFYFIERTNTSVPGEKPITVCTTFFS